jgi:hypothetical protein
MSHRTPPADRIEQTEELAGAVGDALGVAVDRLPITPSGLWELTQQQKLPR